jgi:hypothetical protein
LTCPAGLVAAGLVAGFVALDLLSDGLLTEAFPDEGLVTACLPGDEGLATWPDGLLVWAEGLTAEDDLVEDCLVEDDLETVCFCVSVEEDLLTLRDCALAST